MNTTPARGLPSLVRQLNERHILAALQRHGPSSRAELSRHTGISQPTIHRLVASLMKAKLVEPEQPAGRGDEKNAVGRPGRLVRLARDGVCVLGCVIGKRHCEVVATGLDVDLSPGGFKAFPTPATYDELVALCARHARTLMARRKATVLGLAISVPGLLNRREGRSLMSPNVHLLDGRNLGADLRERLQIDCLVLQECHALCWAEQTFGAAKGVADFAMLDVSEGLGLGVMQGGRILEGRSGLAGEFGHLTVELDGRECGCGNRGCLETVATDAALCRMVGERLGRPIGINELVIESKAGVIDCAAEVDRVLDYLAVAVAGVINIFNPHKLFIYGRLLDAGADLFAKLLERTGRRALGPNFADCEVIRARGDKRLGVLAAAAHAATHGWNDAAP